MAPRALLSPLWDITRPALREAWENGNNEPFHPYASKPMEPVTEEMAGAVDRYVGRPDDGSNDGQDNASA